MTPQGRSSNPDADVLSMGGPAPSASDENELDDVGLRKNKVVFAAFDTANAQVGPTTFHAVITDELEQSVALRDGRLWKRDCRSAAVLLFASVQAVIKISAKRRLVGREMAGPYHDHGFDLARESLLARAARQPGRQAVIAPIGSLTTVLDLDAFSATFAAAA